MAKLPSVTAKSRMALVRAKVERANQNLINMEAGLAAFHGGTPGTDRYIKAKKAPWGETIVFTLPFDSLAAAGDVVNNLRSALDHLIYQLADVFTPNCAPAILEHVAFPIGEDMASYKAAKRRIVKIVHPDAIKIIDRKKPYKSGNDALWLLNKLNNISKHRMLLTVGEVAICQAEWVSEYGFSDRFEYHVKEPHFDGIYALPSVKDYVQRPSDKSIGNPQVMGGDAMLPTLHHFVEVVRALLPEFLLYL
jgi:hypothetical protein